MSDARGVAGANAQTAVVVAALDGNVDGSGGELRAVVDGKIVTGEGVPVVAGCRDVVMTDVVGGACEGGEVGDDMVVDNEGDIIAVDGERYVVCDGARIHLDSFFRQVERRARVTEAGAARVRKRRVLTSAWSARALWAMRRALEWRDGSVT